MQRAYSVPGEKQLVLSDTREVQIIPKAGGVTGGLSAQNIWGASGGKVGTSEMG